MEYLLTEQEFNDKYSRKKRLTKMMRRLKNKRSKPIKRPNVPRKYKDYIESVWWVKRRNEYFRIHDKKCVVCGSEKVCQLHHLVYKDFGFESDSDLACICKD